MSITGKNGRDSIRMDGIWELLLKLAIVLAVPVFTLGSGWAIWITTTSYQHDRDIAVMQERFKDIQSRVHGVSSQIGQLPGKVAAAVKPGNED